MEKSKVFRAIFFLSLLLSTPIVMLFKYFILEQQKVDKDFIISSWVASSVIFIIGVVGGCVYFGNPFPNKKSQM